MTGSRSLGPASPSALMLRDVVTSKAAEKPKIATLETVVGSEFILKTNDGTSLKFLPDSSHKLLIGQKFLIELQPISNSYIVYQSAMRNGKGKRIYGTASLITSEVKYGN